MRMTILRKFPHFVGQSPPVCLTRNWDRPVRPAAISTPLRRANVSTYEAGFVKEEAAVSQTQNPRRVCD